MSGIEQFCGQGNGYSLSKTLRFELKPKAETIENIRKGKFLESDKKKSEDYKDVKRIIDNYHQYFIDDVLQNAEFDWSVLAKEIENYAKDKADDTLLEKEQSKLRTAILKLFSSDKRFAALNAATPKDLFNDILPEWFGKNNIQELNKEAVITFQKFTSYFTGFQENRKNVYSAESIPTAVPYRLVNDNFPKFLQNISLYRVIKEKCPSVLAQVEEELKEYLGEETLEEIFKINSFNKYLCQKGSEKQRGIDFYNQVIGGVSTSEGKKRGFNEFLNLYWQQNPEFAKTNRKIKLVPLYKQILSDRTSLSFKIASVDSDEELKEAILTCADKLEQKSGDDKKSVFDICCDLFENIETQNTSEIYINRKDINNISRILTGDWSWLQSRMNAYADEVFTNKTDKARWQKSLDDEGENKSKGVYSLFELNSMLEYESEKISATDIRIEDYFAHRNRFYTEKETGCFVQGNDLVALSIKETCDDILSKREKMNSVWKNLDAANPLRENADDVASIKAYLDSVQELIHRIKPLNVNGIGDVSFYALYDSVFSSLREIVSLYNKTRNYITKKIASPEKYKLNFDNPTLADGWDLNKEQANTSVLMMKDGKYYLGIMNPKDKPKFLDVYEAKGESCYQKMVYKLLPGPNKMLPKVFFSAKGKATFNPPEYIVTGYEQGKHKKGSSFDISFCHELIDWFKDAINRHEDWKNFNFKFSDTKSYKDISDFYREVSEQGYKLSFVDIPESEITQMVRENKLYLFEIYNKDFAPGATGTPNMHTLYWKNLFSKENLADVVLKLNGEAELFYRPEGIKDPVVHKTGSKLVNKITSEGESIPEVIYTDIYKFENGMSSTLSKEAEEYKSNHRVIIKTVSHDITKDRHYTEPKFLFHVPLTINFKASGSSLSMNERVRKFLKNNPDVNVIGLDRGERHLIYCTLINQKGEILKQFTFNEVERVKNGQKIKVNYHEKLNQREQERDAARKSWQSIGKIAELKEGYLSAVIHQLTKLMVENNAIIVMEDLNFGFKRGRFHVEKQVYQKFEHMLIDKLNYLVFKNRGLTESGGVLNGYQLAGQFESFQKLGKQSGFLFYVPAGYTSKIDPKTGFVDMLSFKDLTNVHKKHDFFSRFDSIRYDNKTDSFVFTFDYKNFDGKGGKELSRTKWNVYSKDKRIVYLFKEKKYEDVNVTEKLAKCFEKQGIAYQNGDDILDSIMTIGADLKDGERPVKEIAEFWDTLLYNFKLVLQMRNSNAQTGEDYIISPVMADDGTFFDSREQLKKGDMATLPANADANGAFNIALKGLELLKRFDTADTKDLKKLKINISNADWFKFIQEKEYQN
ncbi:MAG: type V CRISPR-associated protein Cas12a/Cpf1 [Spirochaetia bacterium]|nr:type V CRISPR-associated protein Cas12a/Cpf1 [Spirochaetia bacterium]